ncbi:late competence development ComFB family protein [Celerinatantimonas sp. YJH-8]|uniref:late competence development ComFB family protein n=1 Tax=Celerinatantimonas sp. YJH-8 TaxID=3228714 RepID=UPI0038C3F077
MQVSEYVHNAMENLVDDVIISRHLHEHYSTDFIDDLVCISLNRLPSRYICFDVDLLSHFGEDEYQELNEQVRQTVSEVEQYLLNDPRQHRSRNR